LGCTLLPVLAKTCDGDAGRNLDRLQAALDDVGVIFDLARPSREHDVERSLRSSESPVAQRVENNPRQRHRALVRRRLGRADGGVPVRALADMELALVELDVGPTESAQF
jgi:hypothetical protein